MNGNKRSEPEPADGEAERLLEAVAAEVTGGLTEAERAHVRDKVRGRSDFLAPLREADLGEGAEPGFVWTPVS